ncbi:MAG: hypothetical protein ACTSQJ_00440 [Promethearchaeota archaeon]
MKFSDKGILDLLKSNEIRNRNKKNDNTMVNPIVCSLRTKKIPISKCKTCHLKCDRYFELIKIYGVRK